MENTIPNITNELGILSRDEFVYVAENDGHGAHVDAKIRTQNLGVSRRRVLISSATLSSDATVEFTSGIDDTYNIHEIEIRDLLVSVDNTTLYGRLSSDAGSSWDSSGYDGIAYGGSSNGTGSDVDRNTLNANLILCNDTSNGDKLGDQTDAGCFSVIRFYQMWDSSHQTKVTFRTINFNGSRLVWMKGHQIRTTAGAYDGIQLRMDSGNMNSGTVNLYGVTEV
jgi:hypothetical protein